MVEAANPRRLEERTARRTALGATAVVGLVGLLAGVMTGTADADDVPRPEPRTVAEQLGERAGP